MQDFEEHRNYLRFVARQLMDARLKSKLDESDIVQETLILAAAKFAQFRGATEAELLGWLRRILVNNVSAAAKRFARERRDLNLEVSLEQQIAGSSARLEHWLAADVTSPSRRACRNEELSRFVQAMSRLPDDQRMAIEMHHLEGLTLAEVAHHLGRTKPSVAGLLFRGMRALRRGLGKIESEVDRE